MTPTRPRAGEGAALALALALIFGALGCSGRATSAPPPHRASSAPPAETTAAPSAAQCSEAAAGLEGGTRGIRDPDSSVLASIRARCVEDVWPAAAVRCFAMMTEGQLGECAGQLPALARQRMFAALGSGGVRRDDAAEGRAPSDAVSTQLALAQAVAKLQALHIGVAACDALVRTAERALACAAMEAELRVQLGAELADFWTLPTALPEAAIRKMTEVCGKWHAVLVQRVVAAGCMP
jgi:hypothetical protein